MKYIILAFIAVCISETQLMADPPAAKPQSLKVMSWNVRYDNPRDGVNAWKHRKDWVAEIITTQNVDVAGLQEVLLGQLNDLKKRLPEMDAYGVGRDDGKTRGEFAPVLFRRERFELLDKSTFWLSRTPEKVGSRDWDAAITRIASWVKLKDRNTNYVFYVINTHFDHRGERARVESAALLVKQLREKFTDHPVILTGDFNTTPDSLPYKTLVGTDKTKKPVYRDALNHSAKKPEGPDSTWNGFRSIVPNRRIDFVFVTDSLSVLQHRILADQRNGRFPSDHLPVLTELELTTPESR
jgi:endonuclease/exonuclease/phosphatase family metal-dependent hydrolase